VQYFERTLSAMALRKCSLAGRLSGALQSRAVAAPPSRGVITEALVSPAADPVDPAVTPSLAGRRVGAHHCLGLQRALARRQERASGVSASRHPHVCALKGARQALPHVVELFQAPHGRSRHGDWAEKVSDVGEPCRLRQPMAKLADPLNRLPSTCNGLGLPSLSSAMPTVNPSE
jgi:hypothetical protein